MYPYILISFFLSSSLSFRNLFVLALCYFIRGFTEKSLIPSNLESVLDCKLGKCFPNHKGCHKIIKFLNAYLLATPNGSFGGFLCSNDTLYMYSTFQSRRVMHILLNASVDMRNKYYHFSFTNDVISNRIYDTGIV